MSDLLQAMADSSRERLLTAQAQTPEAEVLRAIDAMTAPLTPRFDPTSFDVISEIKLSSPSEGSLASEGERSDIATERARDYAAGGAVAISVLTEPTRFGGALSDIQTVKQAVTLPVLRKDFLVDPYQVAEARANGADGVLLIARMLSTDQLTDMIDAAHTMGLFVLLEGFDIGDLEKCASFAPRLAESDLVGINARNLSTLDVKTGKFEELISLLPATSRRIAESGLHTPTDAARIAALGFDAALVGTSLMRSANPTGLLREMIEAGRTSRGVK